MNGTGNLNVETTTYRHAEMSVVDIVRYPEGYDFAYQARGSTAKTEWNSGTLGSWGVGGAFESDFRYLSFRQGGYFSSREDARSADALWDLTVIADFKRRKRTLPDGTAVFDIIGSGSLVTGVRGVPYDRWAYASWLDGSAADRRLKVVLTRSYPLKPKCYITLNTGLQTGDGAPGSGQVAVVNVKPLAPGP